MLELKKKFNSIPSFDSFNLICVVRDEILLLPYFVSYYSKLGVTHFTFIDNCSSDGTFEYLDLITEYECQIYRTCDSYAENNYGVSWVNEILNLQFKDKWCIVVDVDELLFLENNADLLTLRNAMINEKSNIVTTALLDFYPKNFNYTHYKQSESFMSHSNYYDEMKTDFKDTFMEIQLDNAVTLKGGLRTRISNNPATNDSPCLTKKSFFKYDFYNTHRLSEGMHWIQPNEFIDWMLPGVKELWKSKNCHLKFYSKLIVLGHFKYLKPNIFEYFNERVKGGEDWAGPGINGSRGDGVCQEYKNYIENKVDTFYDKNISKKFENNEKVYENTVSRIDGYINDISRFREKSIYVIISEQRHGSTTLCTKINSFKDTVSLYEAFRKEGIFYDDDLTNKNLENYLCKIINGTSWLRDIQNISFKIFKSHNVDINSLMQLSNIKKIIFLKRDVKAAYTSLVKSLKTGNWGTTPTEQEMTRGHTGYTNKIIEYDAYENNLNNWFLETKKLADLYNIPNETIYFYSVINDQINEKIFD